MPTELVTEIIALSKQKGITVCADSQTSSQVGDITKFCNVDLITPTEHEARLAVDDHQGGLISLADRVYETQAKHLLITLGADGVLIHKRHTSARDTIGPRTDKLQALNPNPIDVAGAGDAMLAASSMALVAGADFWSAAYIGSVASGIQTSRVGNIPIKIEELKGFC